ncbi:MAG: 2Fe-2S iron-sulfur cluster-binding protein [Pseudomonadota bacterium]
MKARVEPLGAEFETDADSTLLQSADHAGIELPSSCRNGTCRSCICLLRAGRVRYCVEWPGLSVDEKVEGWTLPCVAIALEDVTLDVPLARAIFPG